MKIDFDKRETRKSRIRDIAPGTFFWCRDTLYLKPQIKSCDNSQQPGLDRMVVNLKTNYLVDWGACEHDFVIETRPLVIKEREYKIGEDSEE